MKSYLINVKNKSIEEVDVNHWSEINNYLDSELFQIGVYLDNFTSIYVDEEGLYREKEAGFIWKGVQWMFSGNGLVNTINNEGEQIDCSLDINYIKENIQFVNKEELYEFNKKIF